MADTISQPADEQELEPQEIEPRFVDPAGYTGRSRLWLPLLAVMFAFLIAAAALMLFTSLGRDLQDMDGAPSSTAQP